MIRIDVNLAIGEKVSTKSIPSYCVYPLATSLALYLSTLPDASNFRLNIHLDPIGFRLFGRSTSVQTLFSS